jgi:hypothetical protein
MSSLVQNKNNNQGKLTYCLDAFALRVVVHVNKANSPGLENKGFEEIIDMASSRKIYNPFRTRFGQDERRYFLRMCPFGSECKGAHSKDEIILDPKYDRFLNFKMKNLDLVKYYHMMLKLIRQNKSNILSDLNKRDFLKMLVEKEIQLNRDRVKNLDESKFIDVLHLWRDLAFMYGMIKKNLGLRNRKWQGKRKPIPTFGYSLPRDVPNLKLDIPIEEEDLMWALNKYTRTCKKHQRVLENLNTGTKFSIKECCGGDINCKFGSHYINQRICIDDLIKGDCDCLNKDFQVKINKLTSDKKSIQSDLKILQSESQKKNLTDKLNQIVKDLEKLEDIKQNSNIHLTYEGLKPFDIQMNEFLLKMKKQEEDPTSIKSMMKSLKIEKNASDVNDDNDNRNNNQVRKIKKIKRIRKNK